MSTKDQAPTARRLREARRRGEVAFSPDVASACVFVVVTVALWALGATVLGLLRELWLHATNPALLARPQAHLPEVMSHAVHALSWIVVPVLGVAALAGIAGSFVQVGGLLVFGRLKPDVKRLNPAEGLKRLFSTRNLFNLLKVLAKTLLLGVVAWCVVRGLLETAVRLGHLTPAGILATGGRALALLFGWAAVVYAIAAAIDFLHERHEFIKRQRMSIDEIRRDHKEAEGDPLTRARRRNTYFEAVYLGLGDRVAAASAVIHSNTVAIALQYLGPDDLPRVIARGENEVAQQIRRLAAECLIPIVADATLAQRLHADAALDQPIPPNLHAPIATLLRWAQGR